MVFADSNEGNNDSVGERQAWMLTKKLLLAAARPSEQLESCSRRSLTRLFVHLCRLVLYMWTVTQQFAVLFSFFFVLRLFYIKEKQTGLSHLTHPHCSNTMKPLCREGWCGIKCSLCKPSPDFVSCQTIDIIDPSDPPALVISNWLNINSLPEVQCYNGSTFIIIIIFIIILYFQ